MFKLTSGSDVGEISTSKTTVIGNLACAVTPGSRSLSDLSEKETCLPTKIQIILK